MVMTADEMGRRRWKGVSKKDRSELMTKAVEARHKKLTATERSAIAKKAAQARWGKKGIKKKV